MLDPLCYEEAASDSCLIYIDDLLKVTLLWKKTQKILSKAF